MQKTHGASGAGASPYNWCAARVLGAPLARTAMDVSLSPSPSFYLSPSLPIPLSSPSLPLSLSLPPSPHLYERNLEENGRACP